MYKNEEQLVELDAIVDELKPLFPTVDRAEIAALAVSVYRRLAATANVEDHLVELTLNETRSTLLDQAHAAEPLATKSGREQRGWANL
jgi:hypothetical protein